MNFRFTAICLFFIIISFAATAQTDTTKAPAYGDSTEYRIFEKVEIEAAYPGGDQAWRNFLERTLNPVVPVDHGAPPGAYTVIIQFVVDKNGNISDLKALTNHGYGMEKEVIRVLQKSPKWLPAVQDGRQVKAYRRQPVTFMISEEGGRKKRKNKD